MNDKKAAQNAAFLYVGGRASIEQWHVSPVIAWFTLYQF